MKKIIIAITVLISSYSFSQGNLQFNRVASDSFTFQNRPRSTAGDIAGTITVAAGKALKMESFSVLKQNSGYTSLYNNGAETTFATIGGHLVWSRSGSEETNIYQGIHYPIWLGQGTYDIILRTGNDASDVLITYSALEFNIVQ